MNRFVQRLCGAGIIAMILNGCVFAPISTAGTISGATDVTLFGSSAVVPALKANGLSATSTIINAVNDREVRGKRLATAAGARDRSPEHYAALWATMKIKPERQSALDRICDRIVRDKARYQIVEGDTGVPWQVVAAIANLESGGDFGAVLHNGERIIGTGKKTRLVPKGRGPFESWESSAYDALKYDGALDVPVWTIGAIGQWSENFNGQGYANRGMESPYVFSMSDVYNQGKFSGDGTFDPTLSRPVFKLVSQQAGVFAVLRVLQQRGEFQPLGAPPVNPGPPQPPAARPLIYLGARGNVVSRYQAFLNVKADGIAGPITESKHKAMFGQNLNRP